jgi:hypothetical protein
LKETLVCHEDGAIEDGDLAAFGLVLAQFHQAIVDRRTAISEAVRPGENAAASAQPDGPTLQLASVSTAP